MSTPTSESSVAFKVALASCSFLRLCALYREQEKHIKFVWSASGRSIQLVSEGDIEADPETARKEMESHLGALAAEQLNKFYRKTLLKRMKAVGGMTVTAVEATGDKAFAYTCGFTEVGGKELLVQNIHRSMNKHIPFNFLYKRHCDGHPLGHGHTIDGGNGVVYFVISPSNVESALLKATKTLEPTRLYGLVRYDILLVVPVGFQSKESEDTDSMPDKRPTPQEILALAAGLEIDGFKPKQQQQGAKPLQICGSCRRPTLGMRVHSFSGALAVKMRTIALPSVRNWTGRITR